MSNQNSLSTPLIDNKTKERQEQQEQQRRQEQQERRLHQEASSPQPPPRTAFHSHRNRNRVFSNGSQSNTTSTPNINNGSGSSGNNNAANNGSGTAVAGEASSSNGPSMRAVVIFVTYLAVNVIAGFVIMTPLIPSMERYQNTNNNFANYNLSRTTLDLYILTITSILTSIYALYKSYHCKILHLQAYTKFTHINRFHPNNTLKSSEEIEEEALEEQCCPNKFTRFVTRYTFASELIVLVQGILLIAKCLDRLNEEIGILDEEDKMHPLFWISLLISFLYCVLTAFGLEFVCIRVSAIGHFKRQRAVRERFVNRRRRRMMMMLNEGDEDRFGNGLASRRSETNNNNNTHMNGGVDGEEQLESFLEEPLLTSALATPSSIHITDIDDELEMEESESDVADVLGRLNRKSNDEFITNAQDIDDDDDDDDDDDEFIATSDITADAHYKAGWKDLLSICYPDLHFFLMAFVFLILAAIAQVYIPVYTGKMLDAIATYTKGDNDNNDQVTVDDNQNHGNIWDVPGFLPNMKKLIVASILGGVFSGVRGSIFTVVGARVNVRLRTLLMDSLLAQDIGFFDITKTGDITSRLSSDTTLVGDQVTLNINVFLRSLVQAIGVLIFMTVLSWQLTLLAFISVPAITIMSRWYGDYIRSLTKLMQKKLADGNSISEAALSAMPTVRAFGAEFTEILEFEDSMDQYKRLNTRNAIAYLGYATAVTSLPQLVTAVVLFYGGLLVMADGDEHITSGQLVTFLLYLQSLNDAFNSVGYIFSSLSSAVGAADKVFELIHRKPVRKAPTTSDNETSEASSSIRTNNKTSETSTIIERYRKAGVSPTGCSGEVTLNKVMMYYPARPQRRILNDMNLYVPSGAVAALVGPSGGGKSSIVSLIQNLYEPRSGDIFIDGIKIRDLSPDWLSKNVAVVSQEPTLFARSIKRNIIYGLEGTSEEPTMQEIKAAAMLANAHDFIDRLPMKYDTDVGERGVQLSGGQKQRIAIARALVRKPKILLLDEATSALDSESEAMVQEAIDKMICGDRSSPDYDNTTSAMTVIIVAHRLSTVQNADIIFVVESGKIVESGSHNELMRNTDSSYANLIKRQIKDSMRESRKIGNDDSSMTSSMMNLNDSLVSLNDDKSYSSLQDDQ